MLKRLGFALWVLCLLSTPSAACVGKTLVIGAVESPEGRVVAQVLAILINERTGTTVKLTDFPDTEALHRGLAGGDVDIAVEHVGQALRRLNRQVSSDPQDAYREIKALYLENLNLIWLPPLGFGRDETGAAAPVARKETLKKFPALPRLIAKTEGLIGEDVLAALAKAGEPARSARQFLRERKLI